MLWNMVDAREADLYEKASRVMDESWTLGDEHIHPGQQAFQKGMCRSRQQGCLWFHDSSSRQASDKR